MKRKVMAGLLLLCIAFSGCGPSGAASGQQDNTQAADEQTGTSAESLRAEELFSDRDFEVGYDETTSVSISLAGDTAVCDSNAVQITEGRVTILDEGTYVLSGALDDGMIIVDADKSDKIQLVLAGVSIKCSTSAPLYIRQADKVFVTLAADSVNTLANEGTFSAIDENNIDGVIFSKEDLTLNGAGTLTVTSPAGHGIVSKDELKLTSGSYIIHCANHALSGKDNICIANAVFDITAGKDGIHAENKDDEALGFVYIESGTFSISAEGDGISAAAQMQIIDGDFDILAGGGSGNAEDKTSQGWGGFMEDGGRPGGFMGGGGASRMEQGQQTQSQTSEEEDSTSIKGIKASGSLLIQSGSFKIDAADDAVHSNTAITVNGGSFEIASGDDAFHADQSLDINDGTIQITECYEGLEALQVRVSGGDITVKASDDGLNAAGGTDQSGFGGPRGGDSFAGFGGGMQGSASSSEGSIVISGGNLYIQAGGDGIDANGTLCISGGSVTVCGPTSGDTSVLDYDLTCEITGGTFIGTGAAMMAQTFSDSEQGVISQRCGSQAAGTEITLCDENGQVILTCQPALSYEILILSSPELKKGQDYQLTVGSSTKTVTAD